MRRPFTHATTRRRAGGTASLSLLLFIAGLAYAAMLGGCSRREPGASAAAVSASARSAAPAPICQPTAKAPEPRSLDLSDEGRLRRAWLAAASREMTVYDQIATGHRPAYEGFIRHRGVTHGPVYGAVMDGVDGPEVSLQLEGARNTRVFLRAGARDAPPHVFAQLPNDVTAVCEDCLATDTRRLALGTGARFELEGGVRVDLRRLEPGELDIARMTALDPRLAAGRTEGRVLALRLSSDVHVDVTPPRLLAARYPNCELTTSEVPEVHIDVACPAAWEMTTPKTRRTCCAQPRYHGPPRSGHVPEDCVDAPTPETETEADAP